MHGEHVIAAALSYDSKRFWRQISKLDILQDIVKCKFRILIYAYQLHILYEY